MVVSPVKKKDTITAPFVDCWWKKSAATKTTGTYFLKLVTMAKSAHKVAVPGHGNTRNACCILIGIGMGGAGDIIDEGDAGKLYIGSVTILSFSGAIGLYGFIVALIITSLDYYSCDWNE